LRKGPRPEKRALVKRILKILTYMAAGLYLLVDAIFMTIARPIADWIARRGAEEIERLDQIIASLSISRLVLCTAHRARANQAD